MNESPGAPATAVARAQSPARFTRSWRRCETSAACPGPMEDSFRSSSRHPAWRATARTPGRGGGCRRLARAPGLSPKSQRSTAAVEGSPSSSASAHRLYDDLKASSMEAKQTEA